MTEFCIGRNIKTKGSKFISACSGAEIAELLNEDEKGLEKAVKNLTADGKIKEFDLGTYKVFAAVFKGKTATDYLRFGGEAAKKIKGLTAVKVQLCEAEDEDIYNFSLGIELASYKFDKYLTKKKAETQTKIIYTGTGLKNFDGYRGFASLADSVRYARDLINEPSNVVNPQSMSDKIKELEKYGLRVEILDEAEMKAQNFNLALAVGQGSVNRPKIAVIEWRGNPENPDFEVGLVGKGVTFDSGGISLKPAANMGDMKQDMTGAAVVSAVMKSVAEQKIKQNVVAVAGLVENMPSGSAYRPGDILKSMSGLTVEVNNTDAEGRLVLADCLTYIQRRSQPRCVIDIATLTGAIVVALGKTYAGLFANSSSLASDLKTVGEYTGERLWQMPTDSEYDKMMDSDVADMKNTGGRAAGSATAACFLQRFVEKNTKWAHLDIAGMDLSDGSKPLYPKGASAFGVLLLDRYIKQTVKEK